MSGQPAGMTLLEAIEADIIPVPEPMIFPTSGSTGGSMKVAGPPRKMMVYPSRRPKRSSYGGKPWSSFMTSSPMMRTMMRLRRRRSPEKDDSLGVPALPPLRGSHRLLLQQQRQRPRRLRRLRQTRPLKARALHEVDLPHPQASQSLLQMTWGRSSLRSTVRIKSHWVSFCRFWL